MLDWKLLPGYEDKYWINSKGEIKNKQGKILRFVKNGNYVELRKNGQLFVTNTKKLAKQMFRKR